MIDRALLSIVLAGLALGGLWWWADANGYERARAECTREAVATATRTIRLLDAAQTVAYAAELRAAAAGAEVITRFEPIEKEVVRYVERKRTEAAVSAAPAVPCLDADGLRIRAAAGAGIGPAAQPAHGADRAVPGLAAGGGLGLRAGPAGERRGLGENLPPMPAAPGVAGGLDQDNPGERP